jgi:hypothetical protein
VAKNPDPYEDYFDPEDEDAGPDRVGGPASFFDALLHKALDAGTNHVSAKMREATGRLAPIALTMTGLVNDAPEPGYIELLVALPGSRPVTVKIPYTSPGTTVPPHHHFQMQKLVGRPVKVRVEVER